MRITDPKHRSTAAGKTRSIFFLIGRCCMDDSLCTGPGGQCVGVGKRPSISFSGMQLGVQA